MPSVNLGCLSENVINWFLIFRLQIYHEKILVSLLCYFPSRHKITIFYFQKTFEYNSRLWKNNESFNIQAGQTGFDFEETKLPTFWSTSFRKLCVGMKVGNDLRCFSFSYHANSLYTLFADGIYRSTNIMREKWKSLIAGSSLQTGCRKQGFNVDTLQFLDVRFGYVGNEQEHCNSTDSYIGFGSNFDHEQYWCSLPNTNASNIAGNLASCYPDNGNVNIAAMAYILVRWTMGLC